MCGRYLLYLDPAIPEIQAILDKMEGKEAAQGEICPSLQAPVIVSDGQGGWTVRTMQWGFPHWERKSPVINARQETVAQTPFFAPSFLSRRCLVMANGYYEWRRTPAGKKTKEKFFISAKEGRLMYLAGVYTKLPDGREVFAVVTRPADSQMTPLHHRMPVALKNKESRKAYLSGPAEAFITLTRMENMPLNIIPAPN